MENHWRIILTKKMLIKTVRHVTPLKFKENYPKLQQKMLY